MTINSLKSFKIICYYNWNAVVKYRITDKPVGIIDIILDYKMFRFF